jgi:Ribbon-helix-helix domain
MNKSPVVKRSIIVGGHKTSVSLEEPFWSGMKEISAQGGMTLSEVVGEIDTMPAGQFVFGDQPVRARSLQEPRRGFDRRVAVAQPSRPRRGSTACRRKVVGTDASEFEAADI